MIDGKIRHLADPALIQIARLVCRLNISADAITICGFAIGMLCIPLLALEQYWLALLCLAVNRLSDGLDGTVARLTKTTDAGAFLDITLDFMFYSGFVFGFVLGNPDQAVFGALLIFSFVANGSAFLAFSVFAERNALSTEARGSKSIYYLGGLAEGFETIIAFTLICLLPHLFWLVAIVFSLMCWISAAYRIFYAYFLLRSHTNRLDS